MTTEVITATNDLRIHQHHEHGFMLSVTDLCRRAGMKSTKHVIERLQSKVTKGHLVLGSKVTYCHLANERGGHPIWYVNKAGAYAILTSRNVTISESAITEIMDAFKGQAVIPTDPYSPGIAAPSSDNALAEAINNMTAFLKSIETRVSALEGKPTAVADAKQTAVAVLDSLIPEISTRLKISQVIRRFVARQSNGYSHQDAFDKLYYEYKYRYHVDLKERAKNAKATSIMDYAEYTDVKEGTHYVDELYGLAQLLFPEN